MDNFNISPNFTVDDIHNLRIQIAERFKTMSKEEAEKDFHLHYIEAKKAIESFRKTNNKKRQI
ncbi:MAG: hypothetical protein LBH29_05475 [Elusimicrobiota bacterium]|jgi:hypothetical protein|nr:hypothetical protein [Elusimicrobiota bacterium]